MLVIEFGILMFVKEVHPLNALFSTLVIEFGIFTVTKAAHPLNELFPMLVTVFPMAKLVNLSPEGTFILGSAPTISAV